MGPPGQRHTAGSSGNTFPPRIRKAARNGVGFVCPILLSTHPGLYTPESLDLAEHADHEHGAILVKPFAVGDLVQTVNQLLET